MVDNRSLFQKFGYDGIVRLLGLDVPSLFPTFVVPSEWYGHPPALVPIMSDGSLPLYIGVWRHWFVHRSDSFVEMSVSRGHVVHEIARTEQQLLDLLCARLIVLNDGVSNEVKAYAKHFSISNLDQIDKMTLDTGDYSAGLRRLPSFQVKVPLQSAAEEKYDGEFPVRPKATFERNMAFEFDDEVFTSRPDSPLWLDDGADKKRLFRAYLESRELAAAWCCLNSRGWSYREASQALTALAAVSSDEAFGEMASNWRLDAEQADGGY